MKTPGLQQRFSPGGICFGCGPANSKGLRIDSHVDGDQVVATWEPRSEHQAFPGMLSGGIIGTLLDCHSNWTAAHHFMLARKAPVPPCTVTAEFRVKLRRPTPVDGPVQLTAHVSETSEDRVTVEATLEAGGKICATCSGVFVAVEPGHPAYNRW
jgi:acyl-coenzyme A thioesterase PaaI-like protein